MILLSIAFLLLLLSSKIVFDYVVVLNILFNVVVCGCTQFHAMLVKFVRAF